MLSDTFLYCTKHKNRRSGFQGFSKACRPATGHYIPHWPKAPEPPKVRQPRAPSLWPPEGHASPRPAKTYGPTAEAPASAPFRNPALQGVDNPLQGDSSPYPYVRFMCLIPHTLLFYIYFNISLYKFHKAHALLKAYNNYKNLCLAEDFLWYWSIKKAKKKPNGRRSAARLRKPIKQYSTPRKKPRGTRSLTANFKSSSSQKTSLSITTK